VHGLDQQRLAVESGYWPLYRYDPSRAAGGQSPFVLDAGAPKVALDQFTRNETRFRLVEQQDPERFRTLMKQEQESIRRRFAAYERLAAAQVEKGHGALDEPAPGRSDD